MHHSPWKPHRHQVSHSPLNDSKQNTSPLLKSSHPGQSLRRGAYLIFDISSDHLLRHRRLVSLSRSHRLSMSQSSHLPPQHFGQVISGYQCFHLLLKLLLVSQYHRHMCILVLLESIDSPLHTGGRRCHHFLGLPGIFFAFGREVCSHRFLEGSHTFRQNLLDVTF